MADAARNKLAARIIKAEMLGDAETVDKLKAELDSLPKSEPLDRPQEPNRSSESTRSWSSSQSNPCRSNDNQETWHNRKQQFRHPTNTRVQKFVEASGSLSQMFVQEKSLTASDEAKMFMKTSAKFSRDDMETKYFSEEIDDSQLILNKSKKHKPESGHNRQEAFYDPSRREQESCDRCRDRQAKHLIVDTLESTYLTLADAKPFLSSMSNVIIRNNDHSCDSFVSASDEHQNEVESMIETLRQIWKSSGYRCILMETHYKNRKPSRNEFVSCGHHFQVHCLPIKEKYYERARMSFKHALLSSEKEWSMNKKLIQTDGRRIQRHLPRGLSYFWVCFDELTNGFGHVIESELEFSRFFGLEVLAGLLDKDFNPMLLNQKEQFNEQFERSRNFKLLYFKFKQQQ